MPKPIATWFFLLNLKLTIYCPFHFYFWLFNSFLCVGSVESLNKQTSQKGCCPDGGQGGRSSSTMKKNERLDRKIMRLFRSAGHPRWAHHMGPKKFQTW